MKLIQEGIDKGLIKFYDEKKISLTFNIDLVKKIKIPLPPLKKQTEIANHITEIRNQAKQLKQQAKSELEQAKKEVEAMIIGET